MKFAANFEIRSSCSVVNDGLVLRISHPRGVYRARIENLPRGDFSTPFLISLHIYFDAASLDAAKEVAEDRLAECLNMLALVTGASLRRHRIRSIVDASDGVSGMRSMLMWADSIQYEDPQPFWAQSMMQAIERLSAFELPPAIRRALRWYRLGLSETNADDQFIYFWFALEIVAEFQKSTDKVASKCPQCQSALLCESCGTHPLHRPYAKQAIKALLSLVVRDFDESTWGRLDKVRNALMHGSTLREVEADLQADQPHAVDVLGRALWAALIRQFPQEFFRTEVSVGFPSTFIHRTYAGVAHLSTVVRTLDDGDLDLSFPGVAIQLITSSPPQSAVPTVVALSEDEHRQIESMMHGKGPFKDLCRRVYESGQKVGDEIVVRVLSTDIKASTAAIGKGETDPWLDVFSRIIKRTENDYGGDASSDTSDGRH